MNKKILLIITSFFCVASSYGQDVRKVEYSEYLDKVESLNGECKNKNLSGFSGFCISPEDGQQAQNNQVKISSTVGLQLASFDYFYNSCEHTDNPLAAYIISQVHRVPGAENFFNEMKTQKEALENYVGCFYYCKSKTENDTTISEQLRWFNYLASIYPANSQAENKQPNKTVQIQVSEKSKMVTSKKPAEAIVLCILAAYNAFFGNGFHADYIRGWENSIVIKLVTPTKQLPLAMVTDQ